MSRREEQTRLENGTVVRHKVAAYEGSVDGTTELKNCFTAGGAILDRPTSRDTFQYRVAVPGESMRRVAPAEDLEVLGRVLEVLCPACNYSFRSRPSVVNKPAGLCECGGWICPACAACQPISSEGDKRTAPACVKQRQRQIRKLAARKKRRDG